METIRLKIKELQINRDGNLVVITDAHKSNPKGAFVMSEAQTASICRRAGVPNVYALKHVEALSNGTSKLEFTAELCKAGDTYTKADGSTGVYGDKDWTKYSGHTIQLGFASKMKLAEISLTAAFSNPVLSQPARKVEVPVVAEESSQSEEEPTV